MCIMSSTVFISQSWIKIQKKKGNTLIRPKILLWFCVERINLTYIVKHGYYRDLTAYLYSSSAHMIFVALCHENSFDPPIPYTTPVFSYQ